MPDIVLVSPRFEASYWGLEYAMPLFGKKANMAPACLPLLAALTPAGHSVTLFDENVKELDFDRITRADIVGLTGMSVQRHRMREILEELKRRGCFVVVGGPWVTVREDYFDGLADVIFVGEAEETWPEFLDDWIKGLHRARYEQTQRTDMTKVPCPRHDLVDARKYVSAGLQISRGCPFQCEFCDIIVTFGRKPRLKESGQVLAELEALRSAGLDLLFIVDDNLIGNKKAIKPILRDIAEWQERKGYPFALLAEATIDLADDRELMELLVAANVQAVFIGVETPNAESLRETKKHQNLRAGGTMTEKIRRVQDSGMEVWTGMILGFDNDDETIFEAQLEFVREARVVHAMSGMLSAIPKTPLYERLASDGRLDNADRSDYGTNVIPKQMTRERLLDGYVGVMRQLNDVNAYFDRADSLYHDGSFQFDRAQRRYWRKHPLRRWAASTATVVRCAVLYHRLMTRIEDQGLRQEYRQRLRRLWKQRRQPSALFIYLLKCAAHYHYHRITQGLCDSSRPVVNTF